MKPEAVLVLMRHGEIVRPKETSNFDRAPLSSEGWRQVNRLATEWPVAKPSAVCSSDFLRAVQSATILQTAFHVPLEKRACLREWTADPADLPQNEYMDLERRAWRDLDWVPPGALSVTFSVDELGTSPDDGVNVTVIVHAASGASVAGARGQLSLALKSPPAATELRASGAIPVFVSVTP